MSASKTWSTPCGKGSQRAAQGQAFRPAGGNTDCSVVVHHRPCLLAQYEQLSISLPVSLSFTSRLVRPLPACLELCDIPLAFRLADASGSGSTRAPVGQAIGQSAQVKSSSVST